MPQRLAFLLAIVAILGVCPQARAQRAAELPAQDIAALAVPAQTHEAPLQESIAAVVNEDILSTADLRDRLGLALLSSGLPDTQEVRAHLLPQVLRGLIDEQLQFQEGKKLDIVVAPDEIERAMQKLAEDNHIPGGDMAVFLSAHGVPVSTLARQIKAVLMWNKVIQREVRPRVDVGDDEVDAVVDRLQANAGKQEYLVSEIFLAVDSPKDEENVKAFAQNLVQQLKTGGNFGAIARQFSQGAGAGNGGDIGWIQEGQLAPELNKILPDLQPGELAGPIRAADGYHILGVREKRTIALGDPKAARIKLSQAFHPFDSATTKESLLKAAARLRLKANGCEGLDSLVTRDFPGWSVQTLGDVDMAHAPAWIVEKTRDIAVGHASEAFATDKGALILFVCARDIPKDAIDRRAIVNTLGTERMELLARRLLRDLRRSAHLQIRLNAS